MLVIHGIWAYGALQIWAEDSARPAQAPPRGGRPSRAPRPHPFAVPPGELADALDAAIGIAGLAAKAVDDELTLRLPSVADGPLASPELVRSSAEEPAGAPAARRVALASWRVPVLVFEPLAAIRLLPTLAGLNSAALTSAGLAPAGLTSGGPASGELASTAVESDAVGSDGLASAPPPGGESAGGLAFGGSIGYLAAVARFAEDLVSRGRLLPVLTAEGDGYAARWRPVLSAADGQRARELAGAIPAACRAADDAAPGPLVAGMLDALADATARTRLPGALLPARRGRRPAQIPVIERTVASLTGSDPLVEVEGPAAEREARELVSAFAEWLAAAARPAGPVRTCFRLVEPPAEPAAPAADDGGTWRVELALQSAEDPSLMLPAPDVWDGAGLGWLAGDVVPEEELLAGLGAAARLFPALDGALREAAPAEVALDTAGALDFLRETGTLLSGAGFGVLLPDWARKARLGLKLTAKSSAGSTASARTGQFGLQDLVDFQYELAVGDEVLSPQELAELARLKVPLVRIRGQWVELDDRHLKAALKFFEGGRSGTMTAGELLSAAIGAGRDLDDLALTSVDADGWLGDLLSGEADKRLDPMQTPAGFGGELRPYQQRGLSWLSFLGRLGVGAILADDMGLGKTVQLLSLIWADRGNAGTVRENSDVDLPAPSLLICPMSLTGNWQREAERFTPGLTVHVHHGADRLAGAGLTAAAATADLVITTYQTAARDLAALSQVRWGRVVCDEAQAIKNHLSQQAKAVRSLPAASRIALTGTPVENQLSELWSIMEFANPGLLGSAKSFRERYAVPVERHGSAEAAQQLRRITEPFVLRRLKTDKSIISDLPEKQEMKVWCNLTQEQASLYQATVTDMMARIEDASDDIGRRGLVLATMARLKQVCNHPAHLLGDGSRLAGRSGKLARLEEICEEIVAEGDRALCFTQYAEFGRMLQPYLAARTGCEVLFLHGGTSKKQRDAMVARFQQADEPLLFLLSLKAGGTGLNLTAANHVIHIDRWWNPAVEDQATDRAFRIGQRRDVQVRKFVCVGTLEERIDAMIERKKALAEQIVGAGESWLTELSTAALREVLALSPDAVSS
ncbi:MAG TPA: DEAD/DEAH box helicase [Trebonia sp.]|nr:DEAD/DEAH box helicase [Trebonia sp.]